MVIAATNGETVVPSSPYAQQVWARIRREVAEVRSRPGAIVDLSSDLPWAQHTVSKFHDPRRQWFGEERGLPLGGYHSVPFADEIAGHRDG